MQETREENPKIKSYKDLYTWQNSIELTRVIYELCKKLPDTEQFGLISQMQRASVSIPSNIAEGFGRKTNSDRCRFYEIARGSLNELDTQLIICYQIGYISNIDLQSFDTLVNNVLGPLNGLINKTMSVERTRVS